MPTRKVRVTAPVMGRSPPFTSNNWAVAASKGANFISVGSSAYRTREKHDPVSTMKRRASSRPASNQMRLAT